MTHYYVATAASGGDDTKPGTVLEPWATFTHANTQISPGDTVNIRGGTYTRNWPTEEFDLSTDGASGDRITWQNYASEAVILQELTSPPTTATSQYRPVTKISGNYVTFQGFEVRNSGGRGIQTYDCVYTEVRDCIAHHCWNIGIVVHGTTSIPAMSMYGLVDGCTIYQCSLMWYHGASNWAAGLVFVDADECTLSNNIVYNSYGDGINILRAGECIIEDNEVYDHDRQEVYLDNCVDTIVRRNLIYHTGDVDFDDEFSGIAIADESYPGRERVGQRRTIINNIVIGTGRFFAAWTLGSGHGLIDDVICNNTFIEARAGFIDDVGILIPAADHSNTIIKNNTIINETGTLAQVPNDADLDFDYNCWYNADGNTPEADAQGPNDINANPNLVDHDHALVAGAVDPTWYKLLSTSPCRQAGLAVTEVTQDYWKTARSDPPDIGAHEYQRSDVIIMTL